jgi:Family of unknown function (DUF6876)
MQTQQLTERASPDALPFLPTADLTCEDGSDNVVYNKQIPFTDFPLEGITFWLTDNTILLPSEY